MRQEKETGLAQNFGDKDPVKTQNRKMEKEKLSKGIACLNHIKSGKTEQVFAQKDKNDDFKEISKSQ
jgi:hypothetical protein